MGKLFFKIMFLVFVLFLWVKPKLMFQSIYKDVSEFDQLGFQDSSSSSIDLIYFHDYMMFFVIVILILVGWLLLTSIMNKHFHEDLSENSVMEVIWTSIPAFMLILIAMPSLYLLYSMDETIDPSLTMKVVGHQWYWSYEYSNFDNEMEFDSYMVSSSDLSLGDFSLLEVDNKIILPVDTNISLMVSSADVIHCWTIPSLGVKVDAIPGSLNQMNFTINSPGKFFGQCSEICGSNHSFMPISIISVSKEKFINWSSSFE